MLAKDRAAADVRLDLLLAVEPAQEGRKPASITVSAVPRSGTTAALTREFKTTLSEPVDDEQWRVLGEGAAYRVIGDIAPVRITRPSLRSAQSLDLQALQAAGAGDADEGPMRVHRFATLDGTPLELKLENELGESSGGSARGSAQR